jgi:hypothetical protein
MENPFAASRRIRRTGQDATPKVEGPVKEMTSRAPSQIGHRYQVPIV